MSVIQFCYKNAFHWSSFRKCLFDSKFLRFRTVSSFSSNPSLASGHPGYNQNATSISHCVLIRKRGGMFHVARSIGAHRLFTAESAPFTVDGDQVCSQPSFAVKDVISKENLGIIGHSINDTLRSLITPLTFERDREAYRTKLGKKLFTTVRVIPRGSRLELFGSSANGFGSPDSDVDMQLIVPCELVDKKETAILVRKIAYGLERMGMKNVVHRAFARVPVIIFDDPTTDLHCDIALSHFPLAVLNTQLLLTYSKIDFRVRELVYLVKLWAKSRQINSASEQTLCSYGYVLMVISFLQNRPVPLLPNLQLLNPSAVEPQFIQNNGFEYNLHFFKPKNGKQWALLKNFANENKESTAELLLEFFYYYGYQHDYVSNVVSIRNGRASVLTKKSVNKSVTKVTGRVHVEGHLSYDAGGGTRLCIEDPFECEHNVSHTLTVATSRLVQYECQRAYNLAVKAPPQDPHMNNHTLRFTTPRPFTDAQQFLSASEKFNILIQGTGMPMHLFDSHVLLDYEIRKEGLPEVQLDSGFELEVAETETDNNIPMIVHVPETAPETVVVSAGEVEPTTNETSQVRAAADKGVSTPQFRCSLKIPSLLGESQVFRGGFSTTKKGAKESTLAKLLKDTYVVNILQHTKWQVVPNGGGHTNGELVLLLPETRVKAVPASEYIGALCKPRKPVATAVTATATAPVVAVSSVAAATDAATVSPPQSQRGVQAQSELPPPPLSPSGAVVVDAM